LLLSSGEETSRWIRVGNCLHKTAVLSGLASLVLPYLLPDGTSPAIIYAGLPSAVLSVGCAALYGISWQFDPCCKYQVTVNSRELSQLNVQNLTNPSPVVLVRKDDKYRKALHNCIAIVAGLYMIKAIDGFLHSWHSWKLDVLVLWWRRVCLPRFGCKSVHSQQVQQSLFKRTAIFVSFGFVDCVVYIWTLNIEPCGY